MAKNEPIEGFFLVWDGTVDPPQRRHPNLDAAMTEAHRLAKKHPGREFWVLASTGHMVVPDPVQFIPATLSL